MKSSTPSPEDEQSAEDERKAALPSLPKDFERVLQSVYQKGDALKEYEFLKSKLTIGQDRGDRGRLIEALDNAEDYAHRAHRLYLHAHIEVEKYNLRCEIVNAPMLAKANAVLQDEKNKGLRSKQITDGDLRHQAAELFPDEWEAQNSKTVHAKGMLEDIKKLSELWNSRCATLRTMLEKSR